MIFNILTDDDKMDIERYIYTLEGRVDKLTDEVNELYRRLQTAERHTNELYLSTHVQFVTGEIEYMTGKNVPVNKLIQCIMSALNLEFKHTDASDTVVKRSK